MAFSIEHLKLKNRIVCFSVVPNYATQNAILVHVQKVGTMSLTPFAAICMDISMPTDDWCTNSLFSLVISLARKGYIRSDHELIFGRAWCK